MLTMWEADSSHALFSKLYNAKLKDTFSFGPLAAGATTTPSEPSEEDNPVGTPFPPHQNLFQVAPWESLPGVNPTSRRGNGHADAT